MSGPKGPPSSPGPDKTKKPNSTNPPPFAITVAPAVDDAATPTCSSPSGSEVTGAGQRSTKTWPPALPGESLVKVLSHKLREAGDHEASIPSEMSGWIHVPYLPAIAWLRNYTKDDAITDLVAGLTVGVMLIPQGMAYALLAHLPPVYGLYSALLPPFPYAFLGTSGQLCVGPVALVSLFVPRLAASFHMDEDDVAGRVKLATQSSLVVGVMLMLMGIFRMGRMLNYISHSVMSGFITAAGMYIGVTQIGNLLGMKVPHAGYNVEEMYYILTHLHEASRWSLLIGLSSFVILLSVKIAKRKYPPTPERMENPWYRVFKICSSFSSVIMVVLTTLLADKLISMGHIVKVVGPIPPGISHCFRIPHIDVDSFRTVFVTCLPMALLAYLESYSVAYKFATMNHYNLDPSQELFALGISNIVGSFATGYPAAGSFSRTAIAAEAGSKTPFTNIVVASVVMIVLSSLTTQLPHIPKSVLGAVIEVAIISLVDWPEFVHAYRVDKADFWVMVITAVATFFTTIEYGLGVGLLMSVVMLFRNLNQIQTSMLGAICFNNCTGEGRSDRRVFRSLSIHPDAQEYETVKVVRPTFLLFFANCAAFKEEMLTLIEDTHGLAFLIIDATGISNMDLSGLKSLEELQEEAHKMGVTLLFANTHGAFRRKAEAAGLLDKVGSDLALRSVEDVFFAKVAPSLSTVKSKV